MSNPPTLENQCRSQEQPEQTVAARASTTCYEDADMSRPESLLPSNSSSTAADILPQLDFAPETNDEKPRGEPSARSALSDRIYNTARPGLSGLTFNSERVVAAVETMLPEDARRYSTDDNFRRSIDAAVSTLDVPTQRYVAALLNQVAETGERPKLDLPETILRNGMLNASIDQSMPVIESLFARNPELRDRLRNSDPASLTAQERALKDTIGEVMNTALFAAYGLRGPNEAINLERTLAENRFWSTGTFSLDMKARLQQKTISFFEQAAVASPQELQALVRSGGISTGERNLIKSIADNGGVMTPEHRYLAALFNAVSRTDPNFIEWRNGA